MRFFLVATLCCSVLMLGCWRSTLLGWVLVTWIVFALTPTKLAHYVLPAYPALAVLAAAALHDGERAV